MCGYSFFLLSIILFLCVFFLLNRLCEKRRQVNCTQADKEVFNREIRALVTILIIFSSTYMLRSFWDFFSSTTPSPFVGTLVGFGVGLICDFAPIMFIMVFHFKNFKK